MILNDLDEQELIPKDIKIERFDMAINFYEFVNVGKETFLKVYEYNPAWKSLYPFYDDVNKTPLKYKSKAKTYKDLIDEYNANYFIDIEQKTSLAKKRYFDLNFVESIDLKKAENFVIYELKYSKTANAYTLYKLFNYILFVDNAQVQNSRMISIFEPPESLIENAKWFLKKEFKRWKLL